jgi:excinuclease ABC subunit A
MPTQQRSLTENTLHISNAKVHNLKNVSVHFPIGLMTCVSGVSGSGKSSLVMDTLKEGIGAHIYKHKTKLPFQVQGIEHIDKMIAIDQSPIGRTPRSNPITYTGIFTLIREWFALLPDAKARGYGPGRFSFNVKGGRCEACEGNGTLTLSMHLLPDIQVTCEACKGSRYNYDTLLVKYKDRSILDVLKMTVDEATPFFKSIPSIAKKLETLASVGLGYLPLGQSATTLSGGEAQRIKLAKELCRRQTGRTLYIMDEPTTGLHYQDVSHLLNVLHRLVDQGNTMVIIEHNLEVIKTADWIIDMGPEGGDQGGEVVVQGPPETVAQHPKSHTGRFLKPILERHAKGLVG